MIKRTVYFGNPAYLSYKNKQLVVDRPGEETNRATISVEDIAVVVLDNSQITMTHRLLQALQDNLAVVISCDQQHLPASIMLPINGHHVMSERMRKQIDISLPLKRQLWKQTIEAKLRNQAALLERLGKDADRMHWLIDKIDPGDPKNVEGRAAAYYWKELLGNDFVRDRFGEPPNALLNYAYAIIRAIIARALVSSGMHPAFGIFHSNKYNMYCLADDIMEPYRPYADELIYDLYISGKALSEELTPELKRHILKLISSDVYIDKRKSPLMVATSRTTNSLFECYEGIRRKLLYPIFHET
ncbi:type II CRISPR-associated endonuclease Cas1 [Puteibacter caeruleilacunae]|nr:type II CRISPR-associated endonuclease Cas1 [Puteibacter caeruleilacunae]